MPTTSLIDFADPRDAAAPRLRHAFASPRQVLVAARLQEVTGVLHAVEAAARAGHPTPVAFVAEPGDGARRLR